MDSTICIWDLENNGALVTSIKPGALQSWRAKFSPDGKHCASGSHTGDLNVYSVENGEKVASYTSKTNFAMCVAYVGIRRKKLQLQEEVFLTLDCILEP